MHIYKPHTPHLLGTGGRADGGGWGGGEGSGSGGGGGGVTYTEVLAPTSQCS